VNVEDGAGCYDLNIEKKTKLYFLNKSNGLLNSLTWGTAQGVEHFQSLQEDGPERGFHHPKSTTITIDSKRKAITG